jgi:AmmeMemoRadiSam system protein A
MTGGSWKESTPHARLARAAIEEWVRRGRKIDPSELGKEVSGIRGRAGAFVSLKKKGELRGCIGTFMPVRESLAQEIVENAISAATRDPRFPPVREDELEDLDISVDVLSEPEPVPDESYLDPKVYGVIVKRGSRVGLLLPDLEGVDTVEEQLRIAKAKAGIYPDEPVEIYRFTVERHH